MTPEHLVGSQIVTVGAHRVEFVEPWAAGEYDPPMQDWLRLPLGLGPAQSMCPECGSHYFGTANPRGYFLVRVCHDEKHLGCNAQFRAKPDARMIADIFEALNGMPRRFSRVLA